MVEVVERVTLLHTACLSDGEEVCHGDFAVGASAAEASLTPLDSATERTFCRVVGGFHSVLFDEDEEFFAVLEHGFGEVTYISVAAVEVPVCKSEESLLERNRFIDQLLTCDGAVTDLWSGAKTMPQPEQARVQRQRVAAEPLGIGGFCDFLNSEDVSFEVSPKSCMDPLW